MLSIDPLFDAFSFQVQSVSYDKRNDKMEAYLLFTLPLSDTDSAKKEAIACSFDEYEDSDWKIEILDSDEGKDVAWHVILIQARGCEPCRYLQNKISTATFWFESIN